MTEDEKAKRIIIGVRRAIEMTRRAIAEMPPDDPQLGVMAEVLIVLVGMDQRWKDEVKE